MRRTIYKINWTLIIQCLLVVLLICTLIGVDWSFRDGDRSFAMAFICTALLAIIEFLKVLKND